MVRVVAVLFVGCALSAALAASTEIGLPRETCAQTHVQRHVMPSIQDRLAGILDVPYTTYDIAYETRCTHWDEGENRDDQDPRS